MVILRVMEEKAELSVFVEDRRVHRLPFVHAALGLAWNERIIWVVQNAFQKKTLDRISTWVRRGVFS